MLLLLLLMVIRIAALAVNVLLWLLMPMALSGLQHWPVRILLLLLLLHVLVLKERLLHPRSRGAPVRQTA